MVRSKRLGHYVLKDLSVSSMESNRTSLEKSADGIVSMFAFVFTCCRSGGAPLWPASRENVKNRWVTQFVVEDGCNQALVNILYIFLVMKPLNRLLQGCLVGRLYVCETKFWRFSSAYQI